MCFLYFVLFRYSPTFHFQYRPVDKGAAFRYRLSTVSRWGTVASNTSKNVSFFSICRNKQSICGKFVLLAVGIMKFVTENLRRVASTPPSGGASGILVVTFYYIFFCFTEMASEPLISRNVCKRTSAAA